MLDRLIESGARATARRHLVRSGLIAVVAHAVIVAGAVWATLVLRAAGIEGRVVLQVVIDTLGRAERAARWSRAPTGASTRRPSRTCEGPCSGRGGCGALPCAC